MECHAHDKQSDPAENLGVTVNLFQDAADLVKRLRQGDPCEIDESQTETCRQRDKQRPEHEPLVKGFTRCFRHALSFLYTAFVFPLAA